MFIINILQVNECNSIKEDEEKELGSILNFPHEIWYFYKISLGSTLENQVHYYLLLHKCPPPQHVIMFCQMEGKIYVNFTKKVRKQALSHIQ